MIFLAMFLTLVCASTFWLLDRAGKREEALRRELELTEASRLYWISAEKRLRDDREAAWRESHKWRSDVERLQEAAQVAQRSVASAEARVDVVYDAAGVAYEAHDLVLLDPALIAPSDKGNA